jgi:iron complex outermembrane receptor protein
VRSRWQCLFLAFALSGRAGEAVAQAVPADAPENIGPAVVSAVGNTGPDGAPVTAAQFAPSRPSINQQQPTSVIGPEAIQKFTIPTSDYNDIVALSPSAMDVSPAGPGLQQDFGQSIRGLQYTQFSVLFDGLQLQPSPGNLSPQPAVYFIAHDIDSVTVNRGPGMASDIGSATFGGFIAIKSKALSDTAYVEPYGTFGSFGTKLYGVELQSGDIAQMNGARFDLDLTREEAAGADTGLRTERRNLFFKYEQPVGQSTLVTTYVNLDNDDTNTPYGTSLKNIAIYGSNYSLNQDPTSQDFQGYNRDNYTSDLEYLRVKSDLGNGYKVEGTIYTQGYYHRGNATNDPGGSSPNLIDTNIYINGVKTFVTDDVQGQANHNDQRDWGSLLRFTKDTSIGQARVGVWFDHIGNDLYRYTVDFTRGAVAYTTKEGATPFQYDLFDTLTTVQPYGEFEFHPTTRLSVTTGVKYDAVTRSLQGPLDRTSPPQPEDYHAAFNRVLPAFSANYRIRRDLSVYGQVAKGYLTPPLNVFYTTNVTGINPSSTWNYQVGTVYQRPWVDIGADLYYIDYSNYISNRTINGGDVLYFNAGSAHYEGVEVEATVKLGAGFAVYANGTLNDSAYETNGNNLAQTPRRTGALGLVYDKGDLFRAGDDLHGLIIAKNVGPQYGVDNYKPGTYDQFPIKSYNYVNLDAGYQLPVFKKRLSFDVQVFNLFDDESITQFASSAKSGEALFWTQAGRSIFFSVSARL